jgi:clan AA aspartic protease
MGIFKTEITLVNARDIGNARDGLISEANIRAVTLDAMPDTGAWTLVINEDVRQMLGLAVVKTVGSSIADGSTVQYGLTEPVEVRWKDRSASTEAVVVPGGKEILLGAIPLEGMDLYVDPVNQRLAGVHGDEQIQPIPTLLFCP